MKNIKIIILTLFWASISFAQDMHFTQIDQAGQFINPAMLGSFEGDHRAILNYKSQWASVINPYKTMAVQYDGRFSGKRWNSDILTFGLSYVSDEAGEVSIKSKQFNLGVGYIKTLNKQHSISAGFQLGWASKGIDQTSAQWDNQYDPSVQGGYNSALGSGEIMNYENNFSYLDMNFGLLWRYTPFRNLGLVTGLSIFHISPIELKYIDGNTNVMSRRWNAHMTLIRRINGSNVTILPSVLFMNQGATHETLLGFKIRYALDESSRHTGAVQDMYFEIGGQYRIGDAFIFTLGYAWRNFQFRAGYALNTSKLSLATKGNGGFEISLVYTTPFKRKYRGNTMY